MSTVFIPTHINISEMLTHFDATNSSKTDPYRAIMQEKSHKMDQMLRPVIIHNLNIINYYNKILFLE